MKQEIEMSFGEHLEELRHRLISALMAIFGTVMVCLVDQNFYMALALHPHRETMQAMGLNPTIQVLRYEESFFCHLKVSIIVAMILSAPYCFYQVWMFISAGLYSHEKRYVTMFFPFMIFFFFAGVLFGYTMLIPIGLRFLAGYGGEFVQVGFTLSSYVSLFFVLTFVSGVIFELPIIMLFLVKIKILTTRFYLENWRYAVLVAFVLAALFTPPDAVTQLLMAGPMILLFFSGIFLCRFSERLQEIKDFMAK